MYIYTHQYKYIHLYKAMGLHGINKKEYSFRSLRTKPGHIILLLIKPSLFPNITEQNPNSLGGHPRPSTFLPEMIFPVSRLTMFFWRRFNYMASSKPLASVPSLMLSPPFGGPLSRQPPLLVEILLVHGVLVQVLNQSFPHPSSQK